MTFLKNWQGLLSLVVAVALFWLSPLALRLIDPTAGAFDAGYLQRPILAAVYLLFGDFIAWLLIGLSFKTLDQWIDDGQFRDAWNLLPARNQVLVALAAVAFQMLAYIACLFAVPV